MKHDPPAVGRVIAVTGSKLTVVLSSDHAHVEFGCLLKVPTRAGVVFGVVTSLWFNDGETTHEPQPRLIIELLGEIVPGSEKTGPVRVQRGISVYPPLGSVVLAVTTADLAVIYAPPRDAHVQIGAISGDGQLPAHVMIDRLLSKHFAILGSTGSGKSCAVALILQRILAACPQAHMIVLDPHNEYGAAFPDNCEVIGTDTLSLPYWMLSLEELATIFVGRDVSAHQAELMILKHAVIEARRRFVGFEDEGNHITADTPVPFRLGDFEHIVNNAMGRLNKAESTQPFMRILSRLASLSSDKRFGFMFSGLVVRDTMAEVLGRLLRVPVEAKPITVLDLSAVPSEVIDVVVSLVSRLIFDVGVWSTPANAMPVLLVCEEAHRYVAGKDAFGSPQSALSGSALSRIAREGRKYGISLGLVSQRPSELPPTLLSQCSTIIALRLANERDQEIVRHAFPDGGAGLLSALPSLHNREALIVGEGVSIPVRVTFSALAPEERPRSGSADFSVAWRDNRLGPDFLVDTVDRWRYQERDVFEDMVG